MQKKELVKIFQSGREDLILDSLKTIRKDGNDHLLDLVLNLFQTEPGNKIENEIIGMLNDLNNQSSVPVIMKHLTQIKRTSIFPQFVSSCWQNGLDYSQHLEFFIDLVLNESYEASIEAFTVVEGNISLLNNEQRMKVANRLKEGQNEVPEAKRSLVMELYRTVERFSGGFKIDTDP